MFSPFRSEESELATGRCCYEIVTARNEGILDLRFDKHGGSQLGRLTICSVLQIHV